MERFGASFELLLASFGAPWGSLGAPLGPLGASWPPCEALGRFLGDFWDSWGCVWALFCGKWAPDVQIIANYSSKVRKTAVFCEKFNELSYILPNTYMVR